MKNPLISSLERLKLTPEQKLEAYRYIRDEDPDVRAYLRMPEVEVTVPLVSLGELADDAKAAMTNPGMLRGLSTGYASLDRMTGGFVNGEITIIFGDTSMGKSQLAQNISINLALTGYPVLFIGLEMTNLENTQRFIQMLGPNKREEVYRLPIMYPKSTDIAVKQIDSVIKTGASAGAKLIVIDHLHAMRMPDANNTNDAIERVMYEIQRVTIKHNLPVLLLSHTSRNGRAGTPPRLHDLRGSGAIEQVTHNALGIWRSDDELDKMKVYCDKNRMGPGKTMPPVFLQVVDNIRLREASITDIFAGAQEIG